MYMPRLSDTHYSASSDHNLLTNSGISTIFGMQNSIWALSFQLHLKTCDKMQFCSSFSVKIGYIFVWLPDISAGVLSPSPPSIDSPSPAVSSVQRRLWPNAKRPRHNAL